MEEKQELQEHITSLEGTSSEKVAKLSHELTEADQVTKETL